jgi:hypothetical protein
MTWITYLASFVGGLLLANGVPHFVNGVSGRRFQSPFASPPGVGRSSPVVNVLWGTVNFAIAFVLIFELGDLEFALTEEAIVLWAGFLLASVGLARHFHRVNAPDT